MFDYPLLCFPRLWFYFPFHWLYFPMILDSTVVPRSVYLILKYWCSSFGCCQVVRVVTLLRHYFLYTYSAVSLSPTFLTGGFPLVCYFVIWEHYFIFGSVWSGSLLLLRPVFWISSIFSALRWVQCTFCFIRCHRMLYFSMICLDALVHDIWCPL